MRKPIALSHDGMIIVVLGDFNPAILHPLWFSEHGLLREGEANSADIEIVHRDITLFRTESFVIRVTPDRFQAETSDPTLFLPLRDLVLGTFMVLEHTPIRAFGLNRVRHVDLPSPVAWQALEDRFVPKEGWQSILNEVEMKSVVVGGHRKGAVNARIEFRLQASPSSKQGVLLHGNEHYDVPKDISPTQAMKFFIDTVTQSWGGFSDYFESSSEQLFKTCQEAHT